MIEGVLSIDKFFEHHPNITEQALTDWFNELVWFSNTYSRDASTKVGAAILDHSNSLWALGVNDFPHYLERSDDYDHPENRDAKLDNTDHAEENAIRECNYNGVALESKIMLTTFFPCARCMRQIKNAHITDIIAPEEGSEERLQRWMTSFQESFKTANGASSRFPSIRVYVTDKLIARPAGQGEDKLALPRMKDRFDAVMHMDRTGIAFSNVPVPYDYLKTWQRGDDVSLSPGNFAGLNAITPTPPALKGSG